MPFLEERMATILNQSYSNWELIIADSYSEDGSWEYLSRFPEQDSRISAYQIPRGLYQAWNFCLEKARGEYVYIATSDDTMEPECIAEMVQALEDHRGCDICDSIVKIIDENGREIPLGKKVYRKYVDFSANKEHIRHAPHDLFLLLSGVTLYTSMTQILIRRSLFESTGHFATDLGYAADFYWALLASANANVIYLPEKLASWRFYEGQASEKENSVPLHEMVTLALDKVKNNIDPSLHGQLADLAASAKVEDLTNAVKKPLNLMSNLNIFVKYFKEHPKELIGLPLALSDKLIRTGNLNFFRIYRFGKKIKKLNLEHYIEYLDQ